MKTYFKIPLLLLFISHVNYSLTQLKLPESISKNLDTINQSDISIRNIYRAYDRVPFFNSDSTINKDYIRASRWMKYVFPKLNIEDSITYSLDDFNKAYKDLLQGGFDCYGSDQANWISDGPYDKDITQENNDAHYGGWVDAVYGDPNNTQRILIGTKTSGIFETDNGGATWHPLTDHLPFPVNGIRQIEPSPNNEDYLVAITGNSVIDGSVIISWDRGNSWVPSVEGPSLNWVEYHPSIEGLLFGVSDEKVYYSNDYGSHWTQLPNPTPLVYHPTHKDIFKIRVQNEKFFIISSGLKYLDPGYSNSEFAFIYEANFTINNSVPMVTWNQSSINNQFHNPTNSEIIFADFSNRIGSRFVIHVILDIENQVRHENDIYQTIDGGITFSLIGPDIDFGTDIQNNNKYLGWRNKNEVIISPNNPDLLYWASLLAPRKISFSNPGFWQGISPFQGNSGHHVDYRCSHLINDNGKDRILWGNDGGIGLTPDATQSASKIESINGDLSINLIHAFHVHEPSKNIAYAFQDHKMLLRFGNSDLYSDGFLNEGSSAFIQDRFPTSVVGENVYFSIMDDSDSFNEIVEFSFANKRLNLGGDFDIYRHYPAKFARGIKFNSFNFSLDPTGGVAINIEKDNSFESNILESKRIGAIGICQRDPNVLYASEFENRKQVQGINDHKLFKTTDGGVSWDNLDNSTVEIDGNTVNLKDKLIWNGIRAIVVDAENPDTLYCGIGGVYEENGVITHEKFRVIKSNDGGQTFTDYSEGLPSLPIEEMLMTESDNNVVFCANSIGVYYRSNNMEKWECFSKNLPNVEITDMQYDYCANELLVSTYGRGMWKTSVPFEIFSSYQREITGVVTWNDHKILKEDLVIKDGGVLTITSTVQVAYDKKIIVEPGGKLNVDGGLLTNYCNSFWRGIEVHGNYQLRQNTTNQGMVEVINGGTIEHARNGIRTIEERNDGTLDWSKTGGIVRVNGGVFKDCRHGIEFMSYHNLSPNGYESANWGHVFNAQFITTDDFLANQTPYAGVTMYDVNGIRIKNSVFEDQRSDFSSLDNTSRGSGIISIDANYKAVSSYSISTGEPIAGTGNEFRNLYYGVMTYGGTGRSDVVVNDNLFEECIYGVGLMGSNYGIIGRNQFNLPEINNNQANPIGYGVYTDGAYGFNIEENVFNTGASSSVDHLATNVRNSSVNASSGKVYRNTINNVYLGTQTIGDNDALKVDCNTYNKGKFSSVDIHHATGMLADQGDCNPINGIPTKNIFDGPCNNNNLAQIFKNPNPVATDFLYSHQENTLVASCHNIGINANLCLTGDFNQCPDELANDIFVAKPIRIINLKSKLDLTKENLENVRGVIASGDTEELIQSIQNDSPGQNKNVLLNASPYLSDRVLITYLTQSSTPPNGHIKQILLANSPLSDTIVAIVNNMSLPNGIRNQINNAQQGVSERRITEGSKSVLNTNRLIYVDAIVQEYLDTNWVDSAAVFLEQEGSLEALCALVPIEVRRKDTTRANAIIDTLRSVAAEMEENEPGCTKSCELNEYCDFQQSVFRIALRDGGYFSITPEERTKLELMANSDARIAVNTKAILHFLDQTLPDYRGEELVFPKSLTTEEEIDELLQNSNSELFSIHPNPTLGNTVFTIEEDISELEIIITDLNGRVVKVLTVDAKEMEQQLEFRVNGVYLVHLVKSGEIQSTKKLIYAK